MEHTTTMQPAVAPAVRQETLRHKARKATDARLRSDEFGRGFFGPGIRLFSRARFLSKATLMGIVLAVPTLGLLFWQISGRYNDAWDARMKATLHHVEIAQAVLTHFHDQELAEEITREQAQWLAKRTIAQLRYNGEDYFWIHDVNSQMVVHPKNPALDGTDLSKMRDADGKAFFQEMIDVSMKHGGGYVQYMWQNPGEPAPTAKISYVQVFKPWGWVIGSGVYMADVIAASRNQLLLNGGIVIATFLLAAYLFVAFYRLMSRGLGDLQFHIRAIRDGDLTTDITQFGRDEVAHSLNDLAQMQKSLRTIVSGVRGSSGDISHSVQEVSAAATDLASRTEQTAANLTESASAMEQIHATATHTAGNTEEGSRLAQQNAAAATHSVQVMGEMVETMQAIRQTSGKIGDIVSTIDSIAFQTNILALNAAVEAARSGEAGRGFAVVAGEVRALAQRSAQASREISQLIKESVAQVEAGTEIVRKSEDAIKDVLESSERVNVILKEISTGAQEQSIGISEVGRALSELDAMTQQNAAMVEQTAATSSAMNDQAMQLSAEVSRFRLPGTI